MGTITYLHEVSKDYERVNKPLWYHVRGLMQTATGYGSKLVTEYMVKIKDMKPVRTYRVYCHCYSNCGSNYILKNGKRVYIADYDDIWDNRY